MHQTRHPPAILPDIACVSDQIPIGVSSQAAYNTDSMNVDIPNSLQPGKQLHIAKHNSVLHANIALITMMLQEAGASPEFIQELTRLKLPHARRESPETHVDGAMTSISSMLPRPSVFGYSLEFYDKYDDLLQLSNRVLSGEILHATMYKRDISSDSSHIDLSNYAIYEDYSLFLKHLETTYTIEKVCVVGFNESERKFLVAPESILSDDSKPPPGETLKGPSYLCARLMLKFSAIEHPLDRDSIFFKRLFEAHRLKATVERSYILHMFITALIKSIQYIDSFSRGELGRSITNIPLLPIIKALRLSPALIARTGCEVQIIRGISPGPEFFEDLLIKYFAKNVKIQQILRNDAFYPLLDSLLTDAEVDYKRVHILNSLGHCRLQNADLDRFLLKYGIDRQLTDCEYFLRCYNRKHVYPVLQHSTSRGGVVNVRTVFVGTCPVTERQAYYTEDQSTHQEVAPNGSFSTQATLESIARHKDTFMKARLYLEKHHYFYSTSLQGAMFRFRLDCTDFFGSNLVLFHPIVLGSSACDFVQHVLASGALDSTQKNSFYSKILDISVSNKHCLRKQDHEIADLYQSFLEEQKTLHEDLQATASQERVDFRRFGDGILYSDGRYEYYVGRQRILLPESITNGDYVSCIKDIAECQQAILRERGENVLSISLIHSATDVDTHIYRGESFSFFRGWKSQCLFDSLNSFVTTIYETIDAIFLPRLAQYLFPLMNLQEVERRHASRICDEIFTQALTETIDHTYDLFLGALKDKRRTPDLSFMNPDGFISISLTQQKQQRECGSTLQYTSIPPADTMPNTRMDSSITTSKLQTSMPPIQLSDLEVVGKDIIIRKGNRAFLDPRNNTLTRLVKAILFEIEKLANRGMSLLEHGVFNYENWPKDMLLKSSTPTFLYNSKEKIKELILTMIHLGLHTDTHPRYLLEVPVTYPMDSVPLVEVVVQLAVNPVSSDYSESIGLYACAYEETSKAVSKWYQRNLYQLDLLSEQVAISSSLKENEIEDQQNASFTELSEKYTVLECYKDKYTTTGYGTNRYCHNDTIFQVFEKNPEPDYSRTDFSVASMTQTTCPSANLQSTMAELLEETIITANDCFVSVTDSTLPHFTLEPSKSEFMTKLSGLFDCYDIFASQFVSFYDSISVDPERKRLKPPEYACGYRYIKEKRHTCLDYTEYCYQLAEIVLELCNIICSAIFNRTLDAKLKMWADIISNTMDLPYYNLYHSTSETSIEDFDYVPMRPVVTTSSSSSTADKKDHQFEEADFDIIREITNPLQIQELSRKVRKGQIDVADKLLHKIRAYYYTSEYWATVKNTFDNRMSVNAFLSLVGKRSEAAMKRTEVQELISTEVVRAIIYYRSMQILVQEHLFPDTIRYGFICITTTLAKQAMEHRISAILCALGSIVTARAWTLIEYSNKILQAIQIQCLCTPSVPLEWYMLRRFVKFYIKPLQHLIHDLNSEAASYLNNIFTVLPLKELGYIKPQFDLGVHLEDPENWAAVIRRLSDPAAGVQDEPRYESDIISMARTTQFSWIFNRLIGLRMHTDAIYHPYKLASHLYSSKSPFGLNKLITQSLIPSTEGIISQSKYDLLMNLEAHREDLTKRQNDLLERVEAFSKRIPAHFNFNEASQDVSYKFFKDGEALQTELMNLQQESLSFINDEVSLELAPGTFPVIDLLQPRIDMIHRFWTIMYEHCTILPVWFDCLLSDLAAKYSGRLSEFKEAVFSKYAQVADVLGLIQTAARKEKSKTMLASLANGERILLKVQSHLAWFKHYSPVIIALLSPALKRRHLDQLRTKGIFLNLAEHTVSKLVERKVFLDLSEPNIQDKGFSHRAKLILEVIEHAQKEHDIELSFGKIEAIWKTVSFEFKILSGERYRSYSALYSTHKVDAHNVPAVHPLSIARAKVLNEHGHELCLSSSTGGSNGCVHSQLDLEKRLYVIANLEFILQLYQDHFLLTNKLLQSQHVTPMQRVIQQFTEKQLIIKEILLLVQKIQDSWLRLYPIYVGKYTEFFGHKANEFINLTICLQTVFLGFINNCNVQGNITIAGNLNQVDKQIEAGLRDGTIKFSEVPPNQLLTPLLFYYKALLDHLNARMYSLVDTKRQGFFRFTFMNTNEIIKILSALPGSTDAVLTPLLHLYSLSDYSIDKHNEQLLLTTVFSKSGETIQLAEPVDVTKEVDVWLTTFDDVFRKTMRKLFYDLYVDVFVDKIEPSVAFLKYPSCTVGLFLRVEFTHQMDAIFAPTVSELDAHHMTLSLLDDINHKIIFFKQQFLTCSNKFLYNNILVELMYFSNIISTICKHPFAKDKKFIYYRIYKYRIVPLADDAINLLTKALSALGDSSINSISNTSPDQDLLLSTKIIHRDINPSDFDVQISCLGNSMFYRFDYIPPTPRSIVTEPMDQAATFIFSAFASRSVGGYIKGETGKTEAVKHIAYCLGYKPYIINPTYTVHFSETTLHHMMLTACAFGLLICFEDVEKFTSSLLITLSRNLGQVYGILNSYTSIQTIANCASLLHDSSNHMKIALPAENPVGEVLLHPSAIFFLTTNTPLPHSFNRVVKPFKCHFTESAVYHVIKSYMDVAGLTEIESVTSQIMHIMGVIRRLFAPFFGLRHIKDIISEMLLLSQYTGKPIKKAFAEQSATSRFDNNNVTNSRVDTGHVEPTLEQREPIISASRLVNLAIRTIVSPLLAPAHRMPFYNMLDAEFGTTVLPPIAETLLDDVREIYMDSAFCQSVYKETGLVCPCSDLDTYAQSILYTNNSAYQAAQTEFITDIKSFIEVIEHNYGTVVVGNHLSGKTSFITVCSKVYAKLCDYVVNLRFINFSSISYHEFFGYYSSSDWIDGIIARLVSRAELHGPNEVSWIICDGVGKMDHLGSILNGTMFLPNGEILRLPSNMKFIFEVTNLMLVPEIFSAKCGLYQLGRHDYTEGYLRKLAYSPIVTGESTLKPLEMRLHAALQESLGEIARPRGITLYTEESLDGSDEFDSSLKTCASEVILTRLRQLVPLVNLIGQVVMYNAVLGKVYRFYNINLTHQHSGNCLFTFTSLPCILDMYYKVLISSLVTWARLTTQPERLTELVDICTVYSIYNSFGLVLVTVEARQWFDWFVRLVFKLVSDHSRSLTESEAIFIQWHTKEIFSDDILSALRSLSKSDTIKPKLTSVVCNSLQLPSTINMPTNTDVLEEYIFRMSQHQLFFEMLFDPKQFCFVSSHDVLSFGAAEYLSQVYSLKYNTYEIKPSSGGLRYYILATMLLTCGYTLTILGNTCSGKSSFIRNLFMMNPLHFRNDFHILHISSLSGQDDPDIATVNIKKLVKSKLNMYTPSFYAPYPGTRTYLIFEDAEVMPATWLEVAREYQQNQSIYDNRTYTILKDVVFLFVTKFSSDFRIDERYLKTSFFLPFYDVTADEMRQIISFKMKLPDPRLTEKLVLCSYDLLHEVNAYLTDAYSTIANATCLTTIATSVPLVSSKESFNQVPLVTLEVLLNISDQIAKYIKQFPKDVDQLTIVRLWLHETFREFTDSRSRVFYRTFTSIIYTLVQKHFDSDVASRFIVPLDDQHAEIFDTLMTKLKTRSRTLSTTGSFMVNDPISLRGPNPIGLPAIQEISTSDEADSENEHNDSEQNNENDSYFVPTNPNSSDLSTTNRLQLEKRHVTALPMFTYTFNTSAIRQGYQDESVEDFGSRTNLVDGQHVHEEHGDLPTLVSLLKYTEVTMNDMSKAIEDADNDDHEVEALNGKGEIRIHHAKRNSCFVTSTQTLLSVQRISRIIGTRSCAIIGMDGTGRSTCLRQAADNLRMVLIEFDPLASTWTSFIINALTRSVFMERLVIQLNQEDLDSPEILEDLEMYFSTGLIHRIVDTDEKITSLADYIKEMHMDLYGTLVEAAHTGANDLLIMYRRILAERVRFSLILKEDYYHRLTTTYPVFFKNLGVLMFDYLDNSTMAVIVTKLIPDLKPEKFLLDHVISKLHHVGYVSMLASKGKNRGCNFTKLFVNLTLAYFSHHNNYKEKLAEKRNLYSMALELYNIMDVMLDITNKKEASAKEQSKALEQKVDEIGAQLKDAILGQTEASQAVAQAAEKVAYANKQIHDCSLKIDGILKPYTNSVELSHQYLLKLSAKELGAFKALTRPNEVTQLIFKIIYLLMENVIPEGATLYSYWIPCRKIVAANDFIDRAINLDTKVLKSDVTDEILSSVASSSFAADAASKTSATMGNLMAWCSAVCKLVAAQKEAAPLQSQLDQLRQNGADAVSLQQMLKSQQELADKTVVQLRDSITRCKLEIETLGKTGEIVNERTRRITLFLGAFADLKNYWEMVTADKNYMRTTIGDSLLICSLINYTGSMPLLAKIDFLLKCRQILSANGIAYTGSEVDVEKRHTYDMSDPEVVASQVLGLKRLLITEEEEMQLVCRGLRADDNMIISAQTIDFVVNEFQCYPLIHDPHEFLLPWLSAFSTNSLRAKYLLTGSASAVTDGKISDQETVPETVFLSSSSRDFFVSLRTHLVKGSVVIVQLAPSFDQARISGIAELLSHMTDTHTKIVFYNTQKSNDSFQNLFSKNKDIRDYIYTVDITSYDQRNYILLRLSSICNPEIDASMVKLCGEYLSLYTSRDQVISPRLYQMIKHVHTSMKDPAIGELILDDVQYFDKMLSSLEQYQIQSGNLAKLMRRIQEKEIQRQEYSVLASCASHLRNITDRLADRALFYQYNFEKVFVLIESTANQYMEQHNAQSVPPEAAEVLIYEAIYLLIAPSLHTNEKLLFELNMALVKELEGKLSGSRHDVSSSDVLKLITKSGDLLDLALDTGESILPSKSLKITDGAFQAISRLESGYAFGSYLAGICKHIHDNPDAWDKALDTVRAIGNTDLEAYNPDIIRCFPSYSAATKTMPLAIWLVIIYHLDKSKFIAVAKSYIISILPFAKTNKIKDHIMYTRLHGERDWNPYLLLQTDPQMILDIEHLARAKNIHITMLLEKQKLIELCTTRTWVILPDIQFHDDHELHCLILMELPAIHACGGMHRDFKLFFTLSDSTAKLSNDLLLNSVKIYWSTPHSIKQNLLAVYEDHFKDIYTKSEADEMVCGSILNKLSYWLLFAFFVLNERLTASSRISVLRFYDSFHEVRNAFLLAVQSLSRPKVVTKGPGIVLGIPLLRALNANKHFQEQGVKHYVPTEIECCSVLSFEGIYYIFGDLYMKSEIQDQYDEACFDTLLRSIITPELFDSDKYRTHPVYGRYMINLQSLFNISQSSNANILRDIEHSVTSINLPELWSLDASLYDILAYREFCLFLQSSTSSRRTPFTNTGCYLENTLHGHRLAGAVVEDQCTHVISTEVYRRRLEKETQANSPLMYIYLAIERDVAIFSLRIRTFLPSVLRQSKKFRTIINYYTSIATKGFTTTLNLAALQSPAAFFDALRLYYGHNLNAAFSKIILDIVPKAYYSQSKADEVLMAESIADMSKIRPTPSPRRYVAIAEESAALKMIGLSASESVVDEAVNASLVGVDSTFVINGVYLGCFGESQSPYLSSRLPGDPFSVSPLCLSVRGRVVQPGETAPLLMFTHPWPRGDPVCSTADFTGASDECNKHLGLYMRNYQHDK
ncbi:Dynein heavy chain, putative [Giardia lamblia P15]|uniref:Dynein heavy chain, putative n=1 Tax=Giardia intestinalis (strain P15) TaxID=658858 RepID=E1F519_GIAIA|nr:Dynein heavy chain, putative [Giardia lamblia P15]